MDHRLWEFIIVRQTDRQTDKDEVKENDQKNIDRLRQKGGALKMN